MRAETCLAMCPPDRSSRSRWCTCFPSRRRRSGAGRAAGLALAVAFGLGSALASALLWVGLPATASAQAVDPELPTRVGRVADLEGELWAYDVDEGEWVSAWRNRPVAQGDRFAVAEDGRAELRIGSSVLRLGGGSELEVLALDDTRMVFELHHGALAWRLRSAEHVRQAELRLREGSLRPLSTGHYRVDRDPGAAGPAWAGVWRGRLEFAGGGNLRQLDAGDRVEIRLDARRGLVDTRAVAPLEDAFAAWALAGDATSAGGESHEHVSPELTGAEELDRHGRWDQHPEYGAVWLPAAVPAGWAPFQDGRWVWMRPWGWTWADAAPWGFAPFHYGRWVRWGARWAWWPGHRGAVPVFQPALVAWLGGPELSIGITIGPGVRPPPPVHWVPLLPYEPYVPRYRPPPWVGGPPYHVIPRPPRQARPPRHVEPVPPPRQRRALPPLEVHRDLPPPGAGRLPLRDQDAVAPSAGRPSPARTVPRGDGAPERPVARHGASGLGPPRVGPQTEPGPVRPPADRAAPALAQPGTRVVPSSPVAPAAPAAPVVPAGSGDAAVRALPPSPRVAPSLPARPAPPGAARERGDWTRAAERER